MTPPSGPNIRPPYDYNTITQIVDSRTRRTPDKNADVTEEFIDQGDSGTGGDIKTEFLSLSDTPASYVGETGKLAAVNGAETALEFIQLAHSATTGITANDHHAEAHTVASHSDTTATGAELDTLTDGSNADSLHVHSVGSTIKVTYQTTFSGVNAATDDFCLAARLWQDETVNSAALDAQPDYARTIRVWTWNRELMGNQTGTVTINGTNADGATIQEVVTVDTAPGQTTYTTDKAFCLITSVVVNQTDAHANDQYSIGIADEWGLINGPLNAAGDVFKVILNRGGVAADEVVASVDTTNAVITLTSALLANDTIEVYHRPYK